MSSRASGGALAASLITAAIIGFAGGAYFGTQADGSANANAAPPSSGTDGPSSTGGPDASPPSGQTGSPGATGQPTDGGLTLTAQETSVAASDRINLSGTLSPPEAGVEIRIQRSIDGSAWEDFPVTMTTRDDGTFSGWIQSQRTGVNSIRVVRGDATTVVSNAVEVTIG
jgi:hypothetical protein